MEKVLIHPNGPSVSRIVYGVWRIIDAKLGKQEVLKVIETCLDSGIEWFDHADIYGNYECEQLFGEAISINPTIKNKISIITKSDICLISDKYPNRKVKFYDTSSKHLTASVDLSLKKIGVDAIDIFLLHRPDPLMDPVQTGKCLDDLISSGKIKFAGVSNFTPSQFSLLQANMQNPLVTNQIEINPKKIEPFINGDLDFLMERKISPMAWSPLAGGSLLPQLTAEDNRKNSQTDIQDKNHSIAQNLNKILNILSKDYGRSIQEIILSWLLNHSAKIIPVIGSTKVERIKQLSKSTSISLNREDWFRIYQAALDSEVP